MEATSPAARCESCGGPSADGELCKSCQQAFAPVLGNATIAEPSDDSATAAAQKASAVETTVPMPLRVVNVRANKVEAIKVEALKIDVSKSETAKAVADLTAKAHLDKAANPAPVTRRPVVSAAPAIQRRSHTGMLLTAAAVIVIAIGTAEGTRRFGFHSSQETALDPQPVQAMPVGEGITAAERAATPPLTPAASKMVAETRRSANPSSKAAASPTPRTVAARQRAVRQNTSDQHVVPVVAPAPAPETPAPVPTKPPALVAAAAPPAGRFFERKDVDEPPQIVTRVEPQLPANLPGRPHNDVVVVRVLVSQTGHPFRVSLLRGSMLGRSSDEAVVAAVTQWTFSPAKKRGEAVNCWYNIGVPLGQAN